MPEGDVVWAAARRLHDALAGRELTRSDFRVPRAATADLTGQPVHEVLARGKHLLIRVGGDLTVHTHLRMEGSWRIRPASASVPRDPRVRLVLANAEWQAVGYSLGIVELLRTSQEQRVVGHLGPDLLGPDWDLAEAVRRLREVPDRPIGEALLDQTRLAGIGNLYKAETLFLRGVDPWRPVGAVPDLEGLVELARRLLDANKGRVGQSTTGTSRPGETTWVYGRRTCRRCGGRIRRADQGRETQERITFWCPACQPGGS
jgi:endonuclease-8